VPGYFADLEDLGVAAKLGFREWTVGAAYRRTNIAGAGPVVAGFVGNVFENDYTSVWSTGVTYETGPWIFGANYIYEEEELPFYSDAQEGQGLQFAAGYTFGPYFKVTGGYQHFEFDGPAGDCSTDTGVFGCDSLDADVAYLESTFSF
jgi:predicted porin